MYYTFSTVFRFLFLHVSNIFFPSYSVLNCVRLLTRVLPYIFEDPDWRGFFWSTLPGQAEDNEVCTPIISSPEPLALGSQGELIGWP